MCYVLTLLSNKLFFRFVVSIFDLNSQLKLRNARSKFAPT